MILQPKHLRAIDLLVRSDLAKKEVAAVVGVHPRTLTRWLKDAAFREALDRRRQAQPFVLDGLRMETARLLLLDVGRRLVGGDQKPALKDLTQLLDRLVGEEFERVDAGAGVPGGPGDPAAPQEPAEQERELTDEEAEALWAQLDKVPNPPAPVGA